MVDIGVPVNEFYQYCRIGKVDMVKKAIKKIDSYPTFNMNINYGFIEACKFSQLDIIELLFPLIDIYTVLGGFNCACMYNNLDVMKWIWFKKSAILIDVCHQTFILACERGQLKIIKWLINCCNSIKTSKITLEEGINTASENYQLHIVDYIKSIQINRNSRKNRIIVFIENLVKN